MKLRTQVVHALVQDAWAWLLRHEGHIVQLAVPGGQGLPDAAWHCRAQTKPGSAKPSRPPPQLFHRLAIQMCGQEDGHQIESNVCR